MKRERALWLVHALLPLILLTESPAQLVDRCERVAECLVHSTSDVERDETFLHEAIEVLTGDVELFAQAIRGGQSRVDMRSHAMDEDAALPLHVFGGGRIDRDRGHGSMDSCC